MNTLEVRGITVHMLMRSFGFRMHFAFTLLFSLVSETGKFDRPPYFSNRFLPVCPLHLFTHLEAARCRGLHPLWEDWTST